MALYRLPIVLKQNHPYFDRFIPLHTIEKSHWGWWILLLYSDCIPMLSPSNHVLKWHNFARQGQVIPMSVPSQGQPANDTYLMILSYGQWLQWRTTEMAPLTGVQPQAGRQRKQGGSTDKPHLALDKMEKTLSQNGWITRQHGKFLNNRMSHWSIV